MVRRPAVEPQEDVPAGPSPITTGWCSNGPDGLHGICRQTYSGQHDRVYVCDCPCHQQGGLEKFAAAAPVVRRSIKRKTG